MRKGSLGEVTRGRGGFHRRSARPGASPQPAGRAASSPIPAMPISAMRAVRRTSPRPISPPRARSPRSQTPPLHGGGPRRLRDGMVLGRQAYFHQWRERRPRDGDQAPRRNSIELWQAMSETVGAGDAFTVTAGCDKQFATCKTKFANGINFRGFPYMPGNDRRARHRHLRPTARRRQPLWKLTRSPAPGSARPIFIRPV